MLFGASVHYEKYSESFISLKLFRNFGEIQINVFPVLPDNKDDRNCTEMNNLLVCSTSLPGKIDSINVKMNDVTMYGRSANL